MLDQFLHRAVVTDGQPLEAPLLAQQVGQQPAVGGGGHAVDGVQRDHHRAGAGVHRGLVGRQVVLEHARQAHVHGVVVAAAFGRAVQGEVLDRRHDAVRGGQVGALVGTDHHAGQQRGQVGVFAEAFRDPPPARVAGDVDHRREAHVEPVGAGFEGGDPRAAGDHLGVPAGGQAEADGKDGAVPVGHVVGMEQRDLQAAMADLVLHGANVRAGHGIEYGADLAGADIRHQRFLGMVGADADQA